MLFPTTRYTLLSRLKYPTMPGRWEQSWEDFFTLYFRAIRASIVAAFRRAGWHVVDEAIVEDRVMEVFGEIYSGKLRHDSTKGHFRQLLQTVCKRRVIDYIRSQARRPSTLSFDADSAEEGNESSLLEKTPAETAYRESEEDEHRKALLAALVSALHSELAPRVFTIFEQVKLHGESPETVANELGVRRGVIDNSIYKAMTKLREIASAPAWKEEFEL